MKNILSITAALALASAPLTAQDFSATRSITAFTEIADDVQGEFITVTDLQELETALPGFFDDAVAAEVTLAGSVTYADAGQTSWIDPAGGDFDGEGFAAGGLYNQYNGEMRSESLLQADFIVATSGSVIFSYDLWFGNSFGGLTSQDRPGQSVGEVRIDDSMGNNVFLASSTFEDGDLSGFANVPLGPGQYTFLARAEIIDATTFETVTGSMTVANFYIEGAIIGGTPVPPPLPDTTPPAAPTGLGAVAGDGSVALDWADNGEADLDGYLVSRAVTSGGPYSALTPSPIAGSAFNDATAANGTTYFYVVTALDTTGNESGASAEASATPTAPTPTLHVASIATFISGPKKHRVGHATIVVVDSGGAAVSGALVTGTFSGDYTGTFSGTTNASGTVTINSAEKNIRTPVFTFCVDSVSHGSFVYDSAQNVETCESYP